MRFAAGKPRLALVDRPRSRAALHWIAAQDAGPAGRQASAAPAAQDARAGGKKIIFLAGPKDHGMPGRHEHEKDLRILAAALEARRT